MNDTKKINVANFELNIPDEFKPEWYKKGIEPHEINHVISSDGMVSRPMTVNNRRGMGSLEEDPVRKAKKMERPVESVWFDAEDQPSSHDDIIDDNEVVNVEPIQKMSVPNETFESIESIRNKILKSNEKVVRIENKAKVGDFIVLYRGKNVFVGDEVGVKQICEKIIMEDKDLTDEDLSVFYRVSLGKFFR